MGDLHDLLGLASSVLLGGARHALPRDAGVPVVLLHGFGCSAQFLVSLERELREQWTRPVVRIELGSGLGDVGSSARRVVEALDELATRGVERFDLVGHSLGGLVATYALKRLDRGRRIRRVVTLGSPHRGTPAALAGVALFGAVSRSMWQLLPGSPFLRRLGKLPVPVGCELVAVAGGRDALVPPKRAGVPVAPRQRTLELPAETHTSLLVSPTAHAAIARLVSTPLAAAVPAPDLYERRQEGGGFGSAHPPRAPALDRNAA